jgi:hypothetical protein
MNAGAHLRNHNRFDFREHRKKRHELATESTDKTEQAHVKEIYKQVQHNRLSVLRINDIDLEPAKQYDKACHRHAYEERNTDTETKIHTSYHTSRKEFQNNKR